MSRVACSILVLAVAATGYGQAQMSPEAMLEGGIRAEVVDGNLTEAIAIYESVASRPDVDRAVAARALLHLAGCYEKLGDDAALAVYQRIRDDYGDVAEVAASARERLAAMGESAPVSRDRIRLEEPQLIAELSMGGTRRSPDGRYGVFTNYADSYNVAVVDYETEEITWMTEFATLEEGTSDFGVWASDSRSVAYAVANGVQGVEELRVFDIGGESRTVWRSAPLRRQYFAARPTSWSPDGRALAVVLANGDGSASIGILDLASGTMSQLSTIGWPRGQTNGPQFSPDGRYLVMVRDFEGNSEIFTLAVDGSEGRRLTHDPGVDAWPIWSRDGSHVLFVSDRLGQNGLWAVPVRGGSRSAAPMLLERTFPAFRGMAWIGERLSFLERNMPRDVYTVSVDAVSGEATGPAQKVLYTPAGANVGVAWSGEGALAFLSRATPDKVVVLHPDGTSVDFRIPTEFEGTLNSLQFDPAGEAVSFADTKGKVASVDLLSGDWTIIRLPEDSGPCCMLRGPDAHTIYYVTDGPTDRLVRRLDLRTGETTRVFELDDNAWPIRMRLSNDGSRLQLVHGTTLSEIDLATMRAVDLISWDRDSSVGGSGESRADLSPDGTKLVIAEGAGLRVVDLHSGASHNLEVSLDQLFAGLESDTSWASFNHIAWAPTGDKIAFQTRFFDMRQWTIPDPLEAVSGGPVSR